MKKSSSVIRNNLYFLKMLWDIAPARVIHTFLNTLIDFATWAFSTVIFVQVLFGGGVERSFIEVLIFIWCCVAGYIAVEVYASWVKQRHEPVTNAEIHRALNLMLFRKAQKMDLSCYETPEFYDTYTKAATEAADRATAVLDSCAKFVASLLSFTYVAVTMCRITPWAIIFIVAPLLGSLYFSKKLNKIKFDIKTESVPFNRCADYVNRVVYFRKFAGELRLTGIFGRLRKMYSQALYDAAEVEVKYAPKKYPLDFLNFILMFPFAFLGMWATGSYLALHGHISLSDFVVLANAIVSVTWMLMDFSGAISESISNSLFIENLKTFLHYEPRIDEEAGGKQPEDKVDTIEFRDVTFVYPGQSKPALQNINLTLRKGVKHALVGINGSGKSTFLKLLLRFYDPTEGMILCNGTDIRELDIKAYRKLIGAAFQDFAMFSVSVTENVLLREAKDEADRQRAVKALKDSDVWEKISTLEKGEDTMMTREFDPKGAELSGGQKQKIAIARAFAKNTPVVVLDEPSSALDPVAEFKMFETINSLCEGEERLSVIVSHRLSSAASCDKIFMFENGILLEEGSHVELMAAGGAYASMFIKQAENYLVEDGGVAHA